MRVTTSRSELLPGLAACATIATPRGTSPLFTNVVLDASARGLTVRATDGFRTYSAVVPNAGVVSPGVAMVRADTLLSRVADGIGDGPVEMHSDDSLHLVQKSPRRAKHQIPASDAANAPAETQAPTAGQPVCAKDFAALLGRVRPFALPPGAGGAHESIGVLTREAQIIAMAFGGKSAAVAFAPTKALNLKFAVPPTAIGDLAKILGQIEGDVSVAVEGTSMHVWAERWHYSARLMAEASGFRYDMERLAPSPGKHSVRVNRAEFLSALKAANAALPKGDTTRRVRLRSAPGRLMVSAAGDGGTVEQVIDAEGGILGISYVVDFLIPTVTLHTAESITLYQEPGKRVIGPGGAGSPCVVRADGSSDIAFVMPLVYDAEDIADVAIEEAA